MSTVKVKNGTQSKNKLSPEVRQIIQTLNDKNIRLSMIEYSNLVHRLISKYRIKPTVLEKLTDFSLPHIYNLHVLGAMTPKMKSMVSSGKIKGTDALKILRKAKNENEFLEYAYQLADTKIDLRKKELKEEPKAARAKAQPKKTDRKEKVKQLLMEIMGGNKISKTKHHTINSLVDKLMAVA
jgi:hypothetical protein